MTIGEVFDFEIGDEFQIEGRGDNQPPNADRIEITGKYYSSNSDTLFYIRFHDSYYSEIVWEGDTHLEYYFWTKTDTIFYTNLDSSITTYEKWVSYDTSMYDYDMIIETSEYYCDSLINGYYYSTNSFEPRFYRDKFGRGLGLAENYFNYPSESIMYDNVLFYFKKNGASCGIPDTTTVSISENTSPTDFNIFPIPANDFLIIENKKNIEIESLLISNTKGQIVKQFDVRKTKLDLSDISSGFYFLKISYENGALTKKIIIE